MNEKETILAYLKREPCDRCVIDEGVLKHCEGCASLLDAALGAVEAFQPRPMTYEEQKKEKDEKFWEMGRMKKSHTWVGSVGYADAARTVMTPFASHCRACGLPMQTFKFKPSWCPKKKK